MKDHPKTSQMAMEAAMWEWILEFVLVRKHDFLLELE